MKFVSRIQQWLTLLITFKFKIKMQYPNTLLQFCSFWLQLVMLLKCCSQTELANEPNISAEGQKVLQQIAMRSTALQAVRFLPLLRGALVRARSAI